LHWHNQTLDHFSWLPGPNGQTTFQQRLFFCEPETTTSTLVASEAEQAACPPVFVYTGNEANVELYVNETGLIWDTAAKFGAKILFMEHRYFGETLPFGFQFKMDPEHMRYLSVEQALADYASIIFHMRQNVWQCEAPVIGFGGSYGGMLASWLRIKYPSAVDGVIAGSAPIWAFAGETPAIDTGYYAQIETYDASAEGLGSADCVTAIRDSFSAIFRLSATAAGLETISSSLGLCEAANTTEQGQSVAGWINAGFSFLAMGSYPYPSAYMTNGDGFLPAYPMKHVCKRMEPAFGKPSDDTLLEAFGSAIGVWYNYTETEVCYNWTAGAPNEATEIDGQLWDYLACTEMVMPMSQDGTTDMFWDAPWNVDDYIKGCEATWGVTPRPYWAQISFGGKQLQAASNIFFSSGELDPWRGGDVMLNSGSIVSQVVKGAGHHMDLMFPQPEDNMTSVLQVRQAEIENMAKWLQDAYAARRAKAQA
jgi:lysosomal Pro-X carboxypeptidase